MDIVSGLLVTLPQPTGFWESILNAFRGANGTYILAVILLALLVRVVFALVDILNKKVSMKNNEINTKMKPELDAIKTKYANDPALMQQKTNEVYKKYQFNMMGSCLPMLIVMVLQLVVFLTLWNSLQAVSNFNIASQYQEMKYTYANIIEVNDYLTDVEFTEGDNLVLEITVNEEGKKVINVELYNGDVAVRPIVLEKEFKTDWTNENIYILMQRYVLAPSGEDIEPQTEETEPSDTEEEEPTLPKVKYIDTGYNDQILALAQNEVKDYYLNTQEGFLWIKNVYKADAPQSPLFTEDEIKNYLSRYYTEDEKTLEKAFDYEGEIFKGVVAGFEGENLGANGYYILTIIAVLASFFSMWLSNFLMRKKDQPKQKQPWVMYVVMPLIMGIFTFMYTSLFAVYLIIGQLVVMALTPLTTFIVRKWVASDAKKKQEKDVVVVDYRRK